jgi:NAD(P)-dependent dehydrogenase (short-subunit alcohol dehydrogenase family)
MRSLDGMVAWVTGGGSGIGRACALALAGAGMRVVVSDRRREALEQTAALAEAIEIEPLDVTDPARVRAAAEAIVARHGRLDVLVANAGLNVPARRWRELTPEAWRQVIEADLNSAFYCAHAVLPQMRKQQDGLIVTISSWAGRFPSYVSGVAYSSAKHALLTMNHSLRHLPGGGGDADPGQAAREARRGRARPHAAAGRPGRNRPVRRAHAEARLRQRDPDQPNLEPQPARRAGPLSRRYLNSGSRRAWKAARPSSTLAPRRLSTTSSTSRRRPSPSVRSSPWRASRFIAASPSGLFFASLAA